MAWNVFDDPAAVALELSRSHTAVGRVDVLHAGKPVYTLSVESGTPAEPSAGWFA